MGPPLYVDKTFIGAICLQAMFGKGVVHTFCRKGAHSADFVDESWFTRHLL